MTDKKKQGFHEDVDPLLGKARKHSIVALKNKFDREQVSKTSAIVPVPIEENIVTLRYEYSEEFKELAGQFEEDNDVLLEIDKDGDDIVVGRLLQSSSLGIYQLAYKISTLPIIEISQVFNKVTFPVYNKIITDKKKLRETFFKIGAIISFFSIIFGAVLITFTDQIVLVILGSQYLIAVPAIRILALFGIVQAVSYSSIPLFLASKKQEYLTAVTISGLIVMGILIYPLTYRFGLWGASVSALIASITTIPVIIYFTYKILKNESH